MIKCIAVDDEPLALKQLVYYLSKVPFFELVAQCDSALEAMRTLQKAEVDVIFLDINMPDLNGLDFARSLSNPPMIVFTTAYQEHALDGYKLNAIDYLLKPFGMAEILRVSEKIRHQYQLIHAAQQATTDDSDTIFMRTEYHAVRIQISNIIYVEGYGEYLRIYLQGQDKPLTVYLRMKEIEERLCNHGFMRIHKSYLVCLHHIAKINKSRITLDTEAEIPIGDSYREQLHAYVSRNFIGK